MSILGLLDQVRSSEAERDGGGTNSNTFLA